MTEYFIRNCLYSVTCLLQINFFNRNFLRDNLNIINASLSKYIQVIHAENVKVREAKLKNKLKKSVESESEKE